jgi:tetratricopeptide (TPR) repeat protein
VGGQPARPARAGLSSPRPSRLAYLIGIVALLALATGAAGVILGQRQMADAQAAVVQRWQDAQAALTAGDDQRALALITDLRQTAPDFEPTAVKSLRIAACTSLARAAEGATDVSAAQAWWACVIEEEPASTAGHQGQQNAQAYLAGQAALANQDLAGALAVWQTLFANRPDYADLKEKLYEAYLAYGDALCAQQDQQGGQAQFAAAQAVDASRPEADAHLAACQLPPTPTTVPPVSQLAVVVTTDALRVRAGPSTAYAVLGRLTNNTTVTITGRIEDTSWVHIQADEALVGWVSTEFLRSDSPFSAVPVEPAPPLP